MSTPNYWIPLEDEEQWLAHLRERGYVVVKGTLSAQDVAVAKDLLWRDLEGADKVLRDDQSTWNEWSLPRTGIVANLAQSAGAWYIRGLESVQRAFGHIWGTRELITSMDAVLIWRPWWNGSPRAIPMCEGLHLDQNPFSKPQIDCVQGMVPLIPVKPEVGGLQVVPYSHTAEAKEQLKLDHPHFEDYDQFCILPHRSRNAKGAMLLEAEAGDLILWDSRTIHGGLAGRGPPLGDNAEAAMPAELARMACTVAMTPRSWASEEVHQARRAGFEAGHSFNHCPHEARITNGTMKMGYQDFELSEAQRAVL
eukprot:TRINITY_DN64058_c0_g1_i1.p1 TRINITY_DN64058_c0_g1~~TRINITY_DN64058_c0_g1_i1.p1  ORF type:complete len:309 (+),score=46.29 TRINITY_DN64058_c0_g1_i1:67-993(+)